MKIGKKLRELRKSRRITLKELSQKSGVQIATLSRMEHDIMTGTLQSHLDVAKALEISLSEFYREVESQHKAGPDIKHRERPELLPRSRKSAVEVLATNLAAKKMMPLVIRLKENGHTPKDRAKHGTEKFLYVLEGRIRAKIGQEEYTLSKGDSIYFEASTAHTLSNNAKGNSAVLAVTSPPVI